MKADTWTIPTALFLAFTIPAVAAAQVPNFDIARSCKSATDNPKSLEACLSDEKNARDLLADRWSKFTPSDRSNCVVETNSDNTPSFVELLVCLQIADEVKKLPKKDVDFAPYPAPKKK